MYASPGPPYSCPRASGTGRLLCFLLLAALVSACDPAGDSTYVVITTSGLNADVRSLRVNAALEGAPVKTDEEFTNDLRMFALRFPSSMRGQLAVTVDGLLASKCASQRGAASTYLGGGGRYDLGVVMERLMTRICDGKPAFTVKLSVSGGGTGSVVAEPSGQRCSDRCDLDFPAGTQVRLRAETDVTTAFVGWTGACSENAPCDLTLTQDVEVGAILTRKLCPSASFCWDSPQPQGNPLRRVFGFSETDVWAVGDLGAMVHYDGKAWQPVQSGSTSDLTGIGGSAPADLFAVGSGGAFLRYTSTGWTGGGAAVPSPPLDLYVAGPAEMTAVGAGGVALRWNGTAWAQVNSTTTNDLLSVFARSAAEQWIAGNGGTILRGNGKSWTAEMSRTFNDLRGIWALSANDVWVVGTGGHVRRKLNGGLWNQVTSPSTAQLNAIHGSGLDNLWIVGNGGTVLRYDTANVTLRSAAVSVNFDLHDVWGVGTTFWAVGARGVIHRFDGTAWRNENRVATGFPTVLGLHASGPRDAWAVGERGALSRWDGGAWTLTQSGTANQLNAVFTTGQEVWAVGDRGTVLRGKPGGTFAPVIPPGPAMSSNLSGVCVLGNGDVWIVGQGGLTLRYRGGAYGQIVSGVTGLLNDVFGTAPDNLWAVGNGGVILRYDMAGERWAAKASGVGNNLNAVWGTSATDMWAVGDGGVILHWDGNSWARSTSGTSAGLRGVWGSGPGDVWAVGTGGVALRFNGAAWGPVPSGTKNDLMRVWGSDRGTLWVAGAFSTILRHLP
jgi:photosystem II stability/assembly factor-like uncharacterized protein